MNKIKIIKGAVFLLTFAVVFVFVILFLSLNVVDNFNSSNFNFFDIPFINLFK